MILLERVNAALAKKRYRNKKMDIKSICVESTVCLVHAGLMVYSCANVSMFIFCE